MFFGINSTSILEAVSLLWLASKTCRHGKGSIARLTSGWKKAPVSISPAMSILHPNFENGRDESLLCETFKVMSAGSENRAGGNSSNELLETSNVVREARIVNEFGRDLRWLL